MEGGRAVVVRVAVRVEAKVVAARGVATGEGKEEVAKGAAKEVARVAEAMEVARVEGRVVSVVTVVVAPAALTVAQVERVVQVKRVGVARATVVVVRAQAEVATVVVVRDPALVRVLCGAQSPIRATPARLRPLQASASSAAVFTPPRYLMKLHWHYEAS